MSQPTKNNMKELTDSEAKKIETVLVEHLKKVDVRVLAGFLAQYIIHKNGRHWKEVLSEIIELNKLTIKGK